MTRRTDPSTPAPGQAADSAYFGPSWTWRTRDVLIHITLANDERFGIWGGLSERERRRLRRSDV